MEKTASASKKTGCGPLVIVAIIVVVIALIFGADRAIKALNSLEGVELTDDQKKTLVTASGPYTYKDYTITLTAEIPLGGGPVNGTISGVCEGDLTGTFDGKDNGAISGQIAGTCSPFVVPVPASANFSGTVNKESKTVSIRFSGKGPGFSHSDSMTLTY